MSGALSTDATDTLSPSRSDSFTLLDDYVDWGTTGQNAADVQGFGVRLVSPKPGTWAKAGDVVKVEVLRHTALGADWGRLTGLAVALVEDINLDGKIDPVSAFDPGATPAMDTNQPK